MGYNLFLTCIYPLIFFYNFVESYLTRRNEYQADIFATETGELGEALTKALVTLYTENKTHPKKDWLFFGFIFLIFIDLRLFIVLTRVC
jgi:Zn-dependent protease with chaperone function